MSSAQTDKVETIAPEPNLAESTSKPAFTAGWGEVLAVAAVGIVPNLIIALTSLTATSSALPYWLDAVQLVVLGSCTIYVTLYLIHRSGDPWTQFGICRPRMWDFPLALCLIALAELIGYVQINWSFQATGSSGYQFSRGRGNADYVWLVLKYAVGSLAEELVTRAYLITRLTKLLRSRGQAVFVAALDWSCVRLCFRAHIWSRLPGNSAHLASGVRACHL